MGYWFTVLFSYNVCLVFISDNFWPCGMSWKVFPLQYPGTVCIELTHFFLKCLVEISNEASGAQYIGYINVPQGMDLHESDVSTLTVENMTISLLLILRVRSDWDGNQVNEKKVGRNSN